MGGGASARNTVSGDGGGRRHTTAGAPSHASYSEFIESKARVIPACGLDTVPTLNPALFPFQHDIVTWALRRGRAAIFAECGLGKTLMQLEWARCLPGRCLVLAPLAVAQQTVREGARFGIEAHYLRSPARETAHRIVVTNYEMLEHFEPDDFVGVVLDESSILKAYDGKTRNAIISRFADTPYRLACTATPAPNDYMELGNHAEFLGVMSRTEMLATYFVHDGGETQQWRLKGHARSEFWKFVASWAMLLRKPSDLHYDDAGFDLPPLEVHEHRVAGPPSDGHLFAMEAATLPERIAARRASVADRVKLCAEIVNASDRPWVVWCNLNTESGALAAAIPGAVEVRGSDDHAEKESKLGAFSRGDYRVIVSKPTIAGFGLNWQHCENMAFVGLSDSWEQYYQAVRRCWRFGQTRTVHCHIIVADTEGAVAANVKRKEQAAVAMSGGMIEHMRDEMESNLRGTERRTAPYETDMAGGDGWTLHLGDCVETVEAMADESVDFTVFSPPFSSLYTYSASDRDMGNCSDMDTFARHFSYLIEHLYRVTKPGRLCSFHCMNLPTSKAFHGYIGIRDFRGDLIRMFEAAGWIFHSEVVIWKDPVTAMQRTKALGLLHKQLKKDSSMSRQGIPDYLVTMRKPGENPNPIEHTADDFPVSQWQRVASPVWMDINPNDTLQFRSAREDADERHICPLQLEVIRRALRLWSRPGDLVLSPFAGIGSEGVVALEMERRFVGVELKRSYYTQAIANLRRAKRQEALFTHATEAQG
ncbi:MAG TPA: DNA methyltransferase [Polyangia bacterium]|nr:DNA methyltransferase [Polyangia bacterium]